MVTAEQDLSYYKGKKVFLTGHTGFKGGWLLACLLEAGAQVKGYALAPEYPSLFSLIENDRSQDSVIADIRDKSALETAIYEFQPDFIFHLAAQPLVRRSYQVPAYTFDVNVTGTANLLEAASKLSHKCTIVVVTTDKVYENREQMILYKESDRLGGHDPYSASKACTEIVVSSFRHSFFGPAHYEKHLKSIASARAGNVIGGADWSQDRILPDIVRALKDGREILVRNPHAIRPWQFVLEPLLGYLRLGRLLDQDAVGFSKGYNFGPAPQDHVSVSKLADESVSQWGNGSWKDVSDPDQPHEANLLQLDIELAAQELKWKPKLNYKEAIKWTIDWYKKEEKDQLSFAYEQVNQFFRS